MAQTAVVFMRARYPKLIPTRKPNAMVPRVLDTARGFLYTACMRDEQLLLGPFENAVLMAVFRKHPDAYSNIVKQELKERLKRDSALGTIATTLRRLEEKGFLTSEMAATTEKRAGRPKRVYSLTALGADALNETHQQHQSIWDGISGDEVALQ